MTEQTACTLLSFLAAGRLSLSDALRLYTAAGSALCVIEQRNDIRSIDPEATDKLAEIMSADVTPLIHRAEEEQEWCEANNVNIITYNDKAYPDRLRQCSDAPLVLYVRGTADLNARHVIDIVGTRKCTQYGQDVIKSMVSELATLCPDIMINSGLAYGVDINAHRAALQYGISTTGIVAHGQDTLYPSMHRNEANAMVLSGCGAVVTEYPRGTRPEARNFLQRNRIIAGMSDATIVVESASHGGGLVTARLAQEYGREVMAVPGPVNEEYSKGCNNLIRDHKASLITSAADIITLMNWQNDHKLAKARKMGIERTIFPELTDEEQSICNALEQHGDLLLNDLAAHISRKAQDLQPILLSLEMRGIVRSMSGNTIHLVK